MVRSRHGEETSTDTGPAMMTSSSAPGTTPPTQVLPSLHGPPAGVEMMVSAPAGEASGNAKKKIPTAVDRARVMAHVSSVVGGTQQ